MATLRINLWSGPRNVSTAIMYAFAQRRDTRVVDEPLYGHYLAATGAEHPGRDEVLAAMDTDGERVVREVILGETDRPVVLFKQMAHHLVGLDWGFLSLTANVLLVRDPADVVRSLRHQIPEPRLEDTGIAIQARLLEHLRALGRDVPVLDARELLRDPRHVLGRLCSRLGLGFDDAMLEWRAGPRAEDGVWAPYWYHAIHRSTGFRPYAEKLEPVPSELAPLVDECRPYYDRLLKAAIHAPVGGSRPDSGDSP